MTALAGERYARKDASSGGRRHGSNPGTVGLAGQRVPIRVPRLRHVAGSEIPLRSYDALHGERPVNDLLLKRVLYGISCRNYEAAAEAIPGAIGLSGSTVSRTFIQASAAKLREFQERDLSGEDVVAVVVDGKTFADRRWSRSASRLRGETLPGLRRNGHGKRHGLTPFLRSLVERGLDVSQGVLVILDGGKGLRSAVRKAFRDRALVHRPVAQARERGELPKSERRYGASASSAPSPCTPRLWVRSRRSIVSCRNQSAARSLAEGLDETLTLHRLGLYGVLGRSMSGVRQCAPVRRSTRTRVNATAGSRPRSWISNRACAPCPRSCGVEARTEDRYDDLKEESGVSRHQEPWRVSTKNGLDSKSSLATRSTQKGSGGMSNPCRRTHGSFSSRWRSPTSI